MRNEYNQRWIIISAFQTLWQSSLQTVQVKLNHSFSFSYDDLSNERSFIHSYQAFEFSSIQFNSVQSFKQKATIYYNKQKNNIMINSIIKWKCRIFNHWEESTSYLLCPVSLRLSHPKLKNRLYYVLLGVYKIASC